MAVAINHVWYANFGNGSSTGYYAVAAWAATHAYTAGQLVRQLAAPAVASERVFICIIAGTSLGSEPTWVLTKGAKTVEAAGPTWMECTGLPALNADLTNTPLSSANRSGAQVFGNLIQNNAGTFLFICTTAGTTGAGEPTYSTTTGATTVDGGCTWTCIGAPSAFTTKWGGCFARILPAIALTWATAGDTVYVSSAHAETQAVSLSLVGQGTGGNPVKVICVGNAGNIPPQSADVTTGAAVSTTGNVAPVTINGNLYIAGIAFTCGSGTNNQTLGVATGNAISARLVNCSLILGGSGVANFALGGAGAKVALENTPLTFNGNTGAYMVLNGHATWRDTAAALALATGSWPTALFAGGSNFTAGDVLFENLDLSAFGGTQMFGGTVMGPSRCVFNLCKLSTAAVATPSLFTAPSNPVVDVTNCDSGAATYRHERYAYAGQHTVDTVGLRTGGASDGTTPFSWRMVTSANSNWIFPFEAMPIVIWNTLTGASRTVTIQGAYNGSALPNNDDIWLETAYFGTAAGTLGARANETKANILATATALTASTVGWDSGATARANTHAYGVGDLIKLASNVGRLFVCTTAGTSAGAEPGGYASAVDGGSVTDGGAVFRAVVRFVLTVTMSSPQPQSAGYFTNYVKAARASSTFWVDPVATLS